jgi:hypothetical protein
MVVGCPHKAMKLRGWCAWHYLNVGRKQAAA